MQGGGQGDAVSRAPALDDSLARAHQIAVAQGHGIVALEHLLFALTDDPDAVAILTASRISVEQLRTDVSGHLGRVSEASPADAGAAPRPGADLLRILQLAGMAARQSQRRLMDGGIVLAAIIGDGNSPAAGLLKSHGLTFEDVIRVLQTAGVPRQQEIAQPPPRAELPPPQPAPPAQAPAELTPKQPAREPSRPSAGDDALMSARARVRQTEPQAIKPMPPPSPLAATADVKSRPAPSPGGTDLKRPDARPGPELQPVAPPRQGPSRLEQRPIEHHRHDSRSESYPPPQRHALQPGSGPESGPESRPESRPDSDRFEPARSRGANLPYAPVTVPVAAPAAEAPPLARLRQGAPSPPHPYAHPVPPPQQPSPQSAQYHPRPVPSVAARPHTPYPSIPPPGPASTGPRPSMPQRADLPPLPHPPAPPSALMPPPHALLPSEPLEIVQAAAGLPAIVRRNVPVLVEIRIPRAQVDVPRHGHLVPPQGMTVVRAVTTRLTGGPVSGLSIEPRTPETAWLGPAEADNRDVIWQYVLLPTRAGTFAVTLSVTGRTLAPNGLVSDASTAAETFAVRVKPERGRHTRRLFSTLVLLALGGAIGWALTGPLAGLVKALIEAARG